MIENISGFYADIVSRALEVKPEIQRYLQARSNYHDAEDLTQETYLHLLEGIATYNPKSGSVESWVKRIAHNAHIDHIRRNARRPQAELMEFHTQHDFTLQIDSSLDAQSVISKVFEKLRPDEIALIKLFSQGFSTVEIAKMWAKPEGTIKGQLHRIRLKANKAVETSPA